MTLDDFIEEKVKELERWNNLVEIADTPGRPSPVDRLAMFGLKNFLRKSFRECAEKTVEFMSDYALADESDSTTWAVWKDGERYWLNPKDDVPVAYQEDVNDAVHGKL